MVIAGVDEAGRGPMAGPVVAAAVILTPLQEYELLSMGLRDSKKMTAKRREKVFMKMRELKVVFGVAASGAREIDRDNILSATFSAMRRAVRMLPVVPDEVVVDGNMEIPLLGLPQSAVVGGDDILPQISAASVAAKVLRDRAMVSYDRLYPGYGFASHKGYGTAAHRKALASLGPCPIHRLTFAWKTGDPRAEQKLLPY